MPRGRPRKNAAGATTIAPAAPRARANSRPPEPFAHKLVLNQLLLSLFNVKRFEELAEHLRNEAAEGLDENNIHHFHHALTAPLFTEIYLDRYYRLEHAVRHDADAVAH